AGSQRVRSSSADSRTIPVESQLQRSVPKSASMLLGPPGLGSMRLKVDELCRLPWVFPPSGAVRVDMFVRPAPVEAVREIPQLLQLKLPQTLRRRSLELRRWPWSADKLRKASLVCKRGHTTPKSAKTVQPSP